MAIKFVLPTKAFGGSPEEAALLASAKPLPYVVVKDDNEGVVLEKVAVQTKVKAKKYKPTAFSSVQKKSGAEITTESVVKEILAINEMAMVGYEVSTTKNLGNYESVKVNVILHVPCQPTIEAAEAAFEEVKDWVDAKLESITKELKP